MIGTTADIYVVPNYRTEAALLFQAPYLDHDDPAKYDRLLEIKLVSGPECLGKPRVLGNNTASVFNHNILFFYYYYLVCFS